MKHERYKGIHKLTDNEFLNLYHIEAVTEKGNEFSYYFASRNQEDELMMKTKKTVENGIVIYPIRKEEPDKIVLIKQYRYPLDEWIYELPAGLIDVGETAGEAAVREMFEETGLRFEVYEGGSQSLRRPFFLGAGITDETSTSVFGYASGEISAEYREESESIQVVLADKAEVKRILSMEKVSLRCAFLLMYFLKSDKIKPFEFLELD